MRFSILAIAAMVSVAVFGCGGGHTHFTAQIISIRSTDGDVGKLGATFTPSSASATSNVLFGIDQTGTEFRAFLDFPLDGSTGGDVVPSNAAISAADIEIFVNRVDFAATVPTLLDLVPFPFAGPGAADFDSAPLASETSSLFRSDVGTLVRIDVTPLMQEAQKQQLRNFQLRLSLDVVPGAAGLVEIDDSAAISQAPLLTVNFF